MGGFWAYDDTVVEGPSGGRCYTCGVGAGVSKIHVDVFWRPDPHEGPRKLMRSYDEDFKHQSERLFGNPQLCEDCLAWSQRHGGLVLSLKRGQRGKSNGDGRLEDSD